MRVSDEVTRTAGSFSERMDKRKRTMMVVFLLCVIAGENMVIISIFNIFITDSLQTVSKLLKILKDR